MKYNEPQGWHSPEIRPYGPFEMSPAASGIHYGQAVWEGLKCYRTPQGKIQLFRPRDNFERLNRSADRLVMPPLDIDFVLEGLKELLRLDEEWVPSSPGSSMYIRPTLFANEEFIGVHPATEYLFYIILSPCGPYYPNGFSPISIYVENKLARAADGGTGSVKTSGNYACSLKGAHNAQHLGYTQVLWLDGKDHKWIEEIGMMNVMFRVNDTFITPMLSGSILPGITRDSVIKLLRNQGHKVEERRISIDEIISACENGSLKEAFGMGTAAVIAPIGTLAFAEKTYSICNGQIGKLTREIYDNLTKIQYGRSPDPFHWIETV